MVFEEEWLAVVFPYHGRFTLESRPVPCTLVCNDLSHTSEAAACVDKENRVEACTRQGIIHLEKLEERATSSLYVRNN